MAFSPSDTKDVSKLVSKKLEWYMNVERRENRFDTQGYYRTTPKMQTLDLMYRVLDSTELDQCKAQEEKSGEKKKREKSASRRSKSQEKYRTIDTSKDSDHRSVASSKKSGRNKEKKEKKKKIQPTIVQNSRQVVTRREADRLADHANKIFSDQPLDKLQVIHRYRPHSSDIPPTVENGRVQNYTHHVGSALHAKNYVDYYMKEGLQTGKKEYSKRLQRLSSSKKGAESEGSEKGSTERGLRCRSPSHNDRKDKARCSNCRQRYLSSHSWTPQTSLAHPSQSFDSIHSDASSSGCSSTPRSQTATHHYIRVPVAVPPHSARGTRSRPPAQPPTSAGARGNRKKPEVYMVIGPGPSRSSSTENRAEVGGCEDYSPFQGSEKWAAECERDGGSFELNVDEESQNGHPHSYVPCRPRMEFEEDSVDLRAKRSAGTPLSEEEEAEEEETEEEEEEEEEGEEEQTYTETEYTAATSLMTNGTVTQRTAMTAQLSFDPHLLHTPRSQHASFGQQTPRTPRSQGTPRTPVMSQAALAQVQVVIHNREGSESARQVQIVRSKRSGSEAPSSSARNKAPSNTSSEMVTYSTEREKAELHARAPGDKLSAEDERAEDEAEDEGEDRAEGNVRGYTGDEDYVNRNQSLELVEASAFAPALHEDAATSTPREWWATGGEATPPPADGDQTPAQEAGGGCSGGGEQGGGEEEEEGAEREEGEPDQTGGGGASDNDDADSNNSSNNSNKNKNNSNSNAGDQTNRGTQTESPLASPSRQPPLAQAPCSDAEEDKARAASATLNRANELEGLDIERGEDEVPDLEIARGKLPEEFRVVPKPERGDEGILNRPAPPSREPSGRSRTGGNYRVYGDDDRGLEKEYFLSDPAVKEVYMTSSDAHADDTVSDMESKPGTRPSSACSQSSLATEVSAQTATTEKSGATGKTVTSEKTKASEKEEGEVKEKKKKKKKRSPSKSSRSSRKSEKEPGPDRVPTPTKCSLDGRGEMSLEDPGESSSILGSQGTEKTSEPVAAEAVVEAAPRRQERARSQEHPAVTLSARLDRSSQLSSANQEPLLYKPPRSCSAGSSRGSLSVQQSSAPGSGYCISSDNARGEDDGVSRGFPQPMMVRLTAAAKDQNVHFPKLSMRSSSLVSQANSEFGNLIYSTRSYETNYSSTKRYSADVSESMVGSDIYQAETQAEAGNESMPRSRTSSVSSRSSGHQPIIKHPPSVASQLSFRADSPKVSARSRPSSRESQASVAGKEGMLDSQRDEVAAEKFVSPRDVQGIAAAPSDEERPRPSPAQSRTSVHDIGSPGRPSPAQSKASVHDAATPRLTSPAQSRTSVHDAATPRLTSPAQSRTSVHDAATPRLTSPAQSRTSVHDVGTQRTPSAQSRRSLHDPGSPKPSPAQSKTSLHDTGSPRRPLSVQSRTSLHDAGSPRPSSVQSRTSRHDAGSPRPSSVQSRTSLHDAGSPRRPLSAQSRTSVYGAGSTQRPSSPSAQSRTSVYGAGSTHRPPSAQSGTSVYGAGSPQRPTSSCSQPKERPAGSPADRSPKPGPHQDERKARRRRSSSSSGRSVFSSASVDSQVPHPGTLPRKRPESSDVVIDVERMSSYSPAASGHPSAASSVAGSARKAEQAPPVPPLNLNVSAAGGEVYQTLEATSYPPSPGSSLKSVEAAQWGTYTINSPDFGRPATSTPLTSGRKERSRASSVASQASLKNQREIDAAAPASHTEGRTASASSPKPLSHHRDDGAGDVQPANFADSSLNVYDDEPVAGQVASTSQVTATDQMQGERPPSVSSQRSEKERPPSVSSQRSEKERPPSVSSQRSEMERPPSVISQRSEKERPPSVSSQRSEKERPPSVSSQRSETERPPSVSSQRSEKERPPSVSNQRSETERPPSVSSQRSEKERPPSVSSQRSEKERPPSVSNQRSDKERPPSVSSQRSEKEIPTSVSSQRSEKERPPSVSSQRSEKERPPSVGSQQSEKERPPSVKSQRSEKERPPSVSSQRSEKERPPSVSSQRSEKERPPSVSSQTSEKERPPSVSSQRNTNIPPPENIEPEIERSPSVSIQRDTERLLSVSSEKETERPPSVSSQKETERPPSVSSQKETERPPSVSSQKETERPPSVSSQKETERPPSVSSEKETERPPSVSSQKETERPPSVSSQKETERPPSVSSQKETERPPSVSNEKETERPPSVSSQKETERPPSVSSQKETERPPSVSSQKETERPPSVSNEKEAERPPSVSSQKETERPPSVSSQKETERPPSVSSQKETERPPSASSEKETERPPSVSSQKETERPPSVSSQKETERPPSVSSQKETERPPSVSSQKETERPPSVSSQKETERPPSVSSQKETERPPSVSSQTETERPPSVSSQKETERPPSLSNEKETSRPPPESGQKKTVDGRPSSAASLKEDGQEEACLKPDQEETSPPSSTEKVSSDQNSAAGSSQVHGAVDAQRPSSAGSEPAGSPKQSKEPRRASEPDEKAAEAMGSSVSADAVKGHEPAVGSTESQPTQQVAADVKLKEESGPPAAQSQDPAERTSSPTCGQTQARPEGPPAGSVAEMETAERTSSLVSREQPEAASPASTWKLERRMESSALEVQHISTEETTSPVPEVQTLEGQVKSVVTEETTTLVPEVQTLEGQVESVVTEETTTFVPKVQTLEGQVETIVTEETTTLVPEAQTLEGQVESSAVQVQHAAIEETTTHVPDVQTPEGQVESSASQEQHAVTEETSSPKTSTDAANDKPGKAGDASHAKRDDAEETDDKAEDIWTVFLEEVKFSTTDDGKPVAPEPSAESTTRDDTLTGNNAQAESSQRSPDPHPRTPDTSVTATEADQQPASRTVLVRDNQKDTPAAQTVTA